MRKLFKERKLFKGGNYMRKYGILVCCIFGFVPSKYFVKNLQIKNSRFLKLSNEPINRIEVVSLFCKSETL